MNKVAVGQEQQLPMGSATCISTQDCCGFHYCQVPNLPSAENNTDSEYEAIPWDDYSVTWWQVSYIKPLPQWRNNALLWVEWMVSLNGSTSLHTVLLPNLWLWTYRMPSPQSWSSSLHCFLNSLACNGATALNLLDLPCSLWLSQNVMNWWLYWPQSFVFHSPGGWEVQDQVIGRLGFDESLLVVHAQVTEGEHRLLCLQPHLGKF